MSRVQLALNVSNIDEAVAFYSKLFATEPAKRKPGYANFAIAEPPLKLVLIEGEGGGTLNHLGVEVETGRRGRGRRGPPGRRRPRPPPASTTPRVASPSRPRPGSTTPTAPRGSATSRPATPSR